MLYMLINRTRSDLTPEQYAKLGQLAQGFYDSIPEAVRLHGDWAANDRSRTFALLETEDPALLDDLQAPFRAFVDIEVVPVTAVTGWGKR
ncbi:DUF3303 domain-containing protein [Thiohalocapsa sp. ML1]|uniref:DUF3303 domain-containing protein n=1 Tax=Thiohalocapsa sp. ML1 TaxID=1431688 RepID=UPI00138F6F4A|nr:DUF3303 family protein [Thiohalocapsa sp. ML1]